MHFTSDNAAPIPPQVLAALTAANRGSALPYGRDDLTAALTARVRTVFEAPDAAVYLVATGTAANALSLATLCPPWGAVFCHSHAHVTEDECGAPEFFTHGAKLVHVPGDHGRIDPQALRDTISRTGSSLHNVQRGALTLTNVTEAGTVYSPDAIAELAGIARSFGLPTHLDGARFANALVATGASPAQMTWQAGVDVLSLGGTKNGLLGGEAVVFFNPTSERLWEFELRRKRAGHLLSKGRYLGAQMLAWLEDDLWLHLARDANSAGHALAAGLAGLPAVTLLHPVDANILFPEWPAGWHDHLQGGGAQYYPGDTLAGRETARLVTSWATGPAEIRAFLDLIARAPLPASP